MSEKLERIDDGLRRFSAWRWAPLAVFLCAVALFASGLGSVHYTFDDSTIQAPAAFNYTSHGQSMPDNWHTQPLKHLTMRAFIALAGNDLVGWRARGVLSGAAIVMMVFLLARRAFKDHRVVLGAATLTALDPVVIAFSRSVLEDVPATFLALAVCLFGLRALETDSARDWVATGICAGLAVGMRWTAGAPLLAILAIALARRPRTPQRAATLIGCLVFVPLALYALAYLPLFLRGYSLSELAWMHTDAIAVQRHTSMESIYGTAGDFMQTERWMLDYVGTVYAWPLAEGLASYQAIMNDPVLWVLFVPSSLYLAWWGFKRRRSDWMLFGGLFLALYAFFLAVERPMLLYSAVLIVPFGFLSVAFATVHLLKRRAWIAIGAFVAWSLYLLPLTLGLPTLTSAHGWVVQVLAFKGTP